MVNQLVQFVDVHICRAYKFVHMFSYWIKVLLQLLFVHEAILLLDIVAMQ